MKWISVKDKIPENDCICIVCHFTLGKTKAVSCVETAVFLKKENRFKLSITINTNSGIVAINLHDVTHWMPLPKNPTEK